MRAMRPLLLAVAGLMWVGQTTVPATQPAKAEDLVAFLGSLPAAMKPTAGEGNDARRARSDWYLSHAKGKTFFVDLKVTNFGRPATGKGTVVYGDAAGWSHIGCQFPERPAEAEPGKRLRMQGRLTSASIGPAGESMSIHLQQCTIIDAPATPASRPAR